jgi:leader peptidase (prepilin peptidase) / N-methyltransferase
MLLAFAFLFGAVVGSFLNVCIWRIPAGESIVSPPSHCPGCGTRIRAYDNIPIVSYLLLGGRCRDCRTRISARYPAVEALTGAGFVLVAWQFGPTLEALVAALFVAALITISFIDLDHQIIPDVISLPGIVVGLLLAVAGVGPSWRDSVLGILLGGGTLWAVAAGYQALTGREGMGGGDIKLLAMVGAFIGWRGVLVTLMIGSLTGAVVGIVLMIARGSDSRLPIPFGPFLALGAACGLFFGDTAINWYLGLALS